MELLVVVGIIGVLIGLLLPVLAMARAQARMVACLSNLRQLDVALTMYLNESHQKAFPYRNAADGIWTAMLAPYRGNSNDVLFCPVAPAGTMLPYPIGSQYNAWGAGAYFPQLGDDSSSYTWNGWMYGGSGPNNPAAYLVLPETQSEKVPTIADGAWVDAWPVETDPVPGTFFGPPADLGNNMGRVFVARHGKSVNAAFLDGHCENVPLAGLWQLRWSRFFQPTTVTIP